MIIHTEIQTLFNKMLSGGAKNISAHREYCEKRCQSNQAQAAIDNDFLNFLANQTTIEHCSLDVLCLAATIYAQKDSYAKPPKFIELLEKASNKPLPEVHRAYLALPSETQRC